MLSPDKIETQKKIWNALAYESVKRAERVFSPEKHPQEEQRKVKEHIIYPLLQGKTFLFVLGTKQVSKFDSFKWVNDTAD